MGISPEMAHKEVGGIASSITRDGKTKHAMEQLEISWKLILQYKQLTMKWQ